MKHGSPANEKEKINLKVNKKKCEGLVSNDKIKIYISRLIS